MSAPYPRTDPRRRPQLLRQLETTATRFLPSWRGLAEPGDPGRALLQLAADLAEHVTSRLDATPERDLKAFLDWLDLAGPSPTPAQAWVVFTLSDKLESALPVRERVQMGAAGAGGDEILFETLDGLSLSLTPARLETVFGVDPGSDRIEAAPPGFGSLEPPVASDPRYALLSFAAAGSRQVQITPPVGLAKGDWVRIASATYAIEDEKAGIYTLEPGLDAAAAAGTPVTRVTRFEPGAMRDLQRHAFYLGHKELLNLEQAAAIDLQILPPGVVGALAEREIAWELWGQPKGEEAPRWAPLEAALGTSSVRLRKAWLGKTAEREVGGAKSRWLRARLAAPLVDAPLALRCDRIELGLSSLPPPAADAPPTVTAGIHNATPLPVSGRFLPFGPEPRLFDQFYLAAPETLSKRGASARLEIKIADASLLLVAGVRGLDNVHAAFGVSGRGHLQLIRPDISGTPVWRDLGRPGAVAKPAGTSEPTADARLDGQHQPAVMPFANDGSGHPRYVVAAVGDDRRVWVTVVAFDPSAGSATTTAWQRIDDDPHAATYHDVVALPRVAADAAGGAGQLFRVETTGLGRVRINVDGSVATSWQLLARTGAAPRFGRNSRLVGVQTTDWPAPPDLHPYELVLVDDDGACWLGLVQGDQVDWSALGAGPGAASREIRPSASRLAPDALYLLVATADGAGVELRLRNAATTSSVGQAATPKIVAGSAILSVPRGSAPEVVSLLEVGDPDRPDLVLLAGTAVAETLNASLEAPGSTITTAWLGADAGGTVELLVAATKEKVFRRPLTLDAMTVETLRDALILENQEHTAHYAAVSDGATTRLLELDPAVMHDEATDRRIYAIEQSAQLAAGETYTFFRSVATHSGQAQAADQLELDPGDSVTALGTPLVIGSDLHRVSHVDASVTPPVVTVTPDIAGAPGNIAYEVVQQHGAPRQVAAQDLGAIARLATSGPTVALQAGDRLLLPLGTNPATQRILDFRDAGVAAFNVYLEAGWNPQPGLPVSAARASFANAASWLPVPFARAYQNPELTWEYFDGRGWRRLQKGFFDETGHLVVSGAIGFEVPDDLSQIKVAGQEDYWIRARLIGGDYGQPIYRIDADPVVPPLIFNSKITIDRSEVNPPEILSIEAGFALVQTAAPELTLTDNNLGLVDQTAAAGTAGAVFDLFAAAATLDPAVPGPALYLAFSKPFAAEPLRLLVDAAEQEGLVRLTWEVLAEGRWQEVPLAGEDPTHGLLRPGIVALDVRARPTRAVLFGRTAHWLRARPAAAGPWQPDLAGIWLNAAPAEQAATIRNELLGSTTGEPAARLRLAQAPVLPGSLELRVRERLGGEEQAALTAAAGADAVLSDLPDLPGQWVRWQSIDSFVDAAPDARVYRLDPRTGVIVFGDDRQGLIPPAGADNVRAFRYRHGAGRDGNVAAHTVTGLKSALSGVEAVTNPLPARGGSDGRDDAESGAQAVATVRHVGRAITPRDVEALALDFAPEILRARCVRPAAAAGRIRVAVAVASPDRMPQPSVALRDGLARFLADRASSSWPAEAFEVVGPEFVPLRLQIELTPAPGSPASLGALVEDRLLALLHPTAGGHDGRGWPFGRGLWPSDVHRALAGILGEARIAEPLIARTDGHGAADAIGPAALITALPDDISVRVLESAR